MQFGGRTYATYSLGAVADLIAICLVVIVAVAICGSILIAISKTRRQRNIGVGAAVCCFAALFGIVGCWVSVTGHNAYVGGEVADMICAEYSLDGKREAREGIAEAINNGGGIVNLGTVAVPICQDNCKIGVQEEELVCDIAVQEYENAIDPVKSNVMVDAAMYKADSERKWVKVSPLPSDTSGNVMNQTYHTWTYC